MVKAVEHAHCEPMGVPWHDDGYAGPRRDQEIQRIHHGHSVVVVQSGVGRIGEVSQTRTDCGWQAQQIACVEESLILREHAADGYRHLRRRAGRADAEARGKDSPTRVSSG